MLSIVSLLLFVELTFSNFYCFILFIVYKCFVLSFRIGFCFNVALTGILPLSCVCKQWKFWMHVLCLTPQHFCACFKHMLWYFCVQCVFRWEVIVLVLLLILLELLTITVWTGFYTPAPLEGWYTVIPPLHRRGVYCFTSVRPSICLSVLPSIPRYLSLHFSQQLLMAEFWYLVISFI